MTPCIPILNYSNNNCELISILLRFTGKLGAEGPWRSNPIIQYRQCTLLPQYLECHLDTTDCPGPAKPDYTDSLNWNSLKDLFVCTYKNAIQQTNVLGVQYLKKQNILLQEKSMIRGLEPSVTGIICWSIVLKTPSLIVVSWLSDKSI